MNMPEELPSIERLLSYTESKFALVKLAATRAREINSYYNEHGAGVRIPPQILSRASKSLTIAFEEIEAGAIRLGETTDAAFFALAISILDGEPGEFYLRSSSELDLRRILRPLTRIANVAGYGLQPWEIRRGSFWGRLSPYGDGRSFSSKEEAEIQRSAKIRPMKAHESPAAIEFSEAVRQLSDGASAQDEIVLLNAALIIARLKLDGVWRVLYRELTPYEQAQYREGKLDLNLSDNHEVLLFINSPRQKSRATG